MCAYKNYVNFYTTEKLSLSTGSAEERKKKRTRAIKVSYFLILPYKIYIYHTLQSEVVGVRAKFEVEISISFQSDEFFVGEIWKYVRTPLEIVLGIIFQEFFVFLLVIEHVTFFASFISI